MTDSDGLPETIRHFRRSGSCPLVVGIFKHVPRNLVQDVSGMGKTMFGRCNVIHKVNALVGKRYHNNIYL